MLSSEFKRLRAADVCGFLNELLCVLDLALLTSVVSERARCAAAAAALWFGLSVLS